MINDALQLTRPEGLDRILDDTAALGFTAQCEDKTGALLRLLAATKPGGRFLEIGTGTGVSACWLHEGMSGGARLESVELEPEHHNVAVKHLGRHQDIKLVLGDAVAFIDNLDGQYDLIFADTFPGKFTHRERVLDAVKAGGYYIVDDLLPQVNWPQDEHPLKVRDLVAALEADPRFHILKLNWASGLVVCVRKG
jgi:predicted O-methyltransferase YrrM